MGERGFLVRRCRAGELTTAVTSFLSEEEAGEHVLFGILANLWRDEGFYGDGYYLAYVLDGSGVCAVAVRTPPHNLVLSRLAHPGACAAIADDAAAAFGTLPGVYLRASAATSFLAAWRERTGRAGRHLMSQRTLMATEVTRTDVEGMLLRASTDELDVVVAWSEAMEAEALPRGMPRLDHRAVLERQMAEPDEGAGAYLWLVDGQPVSFARTGSRTPNGTRISAVYTPPEHRNKGYGSAVTAAVTAKMLRRSAFTVLNADAANPTSNRIYERIGYRAVADHAVHAFDGGEEGSG